MLLVDIISQTGKASSLCPISLDKGRKLIFNISLQANSMKESILTKGNFRYKVYPKILDVFPKILDVLLLLQEKVIGLLSSKTMNSLTLFKS